MRIFLLAAGAVGLAGCSHAPAPAAGPLAANDFENLAGWLADSPAQATLTRQQAHSGRYSSRVGPGHDYSLGYSNLLSELATERPTRLRISAWVQQTGPEPSPKLVTELKSPQGGRLLWEGLNVGTVARAPGKWYRVEQTITLPPTAPPDSRLLVYLWRAESNTPTYLDDLEISLPTP